MTSKSHGLLWALILTLAGCSNGGLLHVRHAKFMFGDPVPVAQLSHLPVHPPPGANQVVHLFHNRYPSSNNNGKYISSVHHRSGNVFTDYDSPAKECPHARAELHMLAPKSHSLPSAQMYLPAIQERKYQSLGMGTTCPPPPDNFKVAYFNGNCYYYSCIYFSTWFAAMTQCQKAPLGGHLVAISNEKEMDFLKTTLKDMMIDRNCTRTFFHPRAWIGLTLYDQHQTPELKGLMWSDADAKFPVAYENWGPGQPNDLKGQNLCTSMSVDDSRWELENCSDENLPFICKIGAVDERRGWKKSRKYHHQVYR